MMHDEVVRHIERGEALVKQAQHEGDSARVRRLLDEAQDAFHVAQQVLETLRRQIDDAEKSQTAWDWR